MHKKLNQLIFTCNKYKIQILFAILVYSFVKCSNPSTQSQSTPEKTGFTLSSIGSLDDSTMEIIIKADKILEYIPDIVVDGKIIDSLLSEPNLWIIKGLSPSKNIDYQIIFNNDTLLDSVSLPKRIDSLYCNGIYLPNHFSGSMQRDSIYEFSWASHEKAKYSYISISTNLDTPFTYFGVDSRFKIILNLTDKDTIGHFNVHLEASMNPQLTVNKTPDIETNKSYIQYELRSPTYNAYFYFGL